jgi:hypothetical protein
MNPDLQKIEDILLASQRGLLCGLHMSVPPLMLQVALTHYS